MGIIRDVVLFDGFDTYGADATYVAVLVETDIPDKNGNVYYVEILTERHLWVELWHSSDSYANAADAMNRLV